MSDACQEKNLAEKTRKRYHRYAYASTWFGCFADVMLENSAVIILYFAILGANNTLIMLSTGISGIMSMLLLIPAACIVDRLGPRKVINISCILACIAYLIMASAPIGGAAAQYIVLGGCVIFCISKPLWTAAWYPILGDILKPSERGDFLGFMRFSYYILSGSVFFLLGVVMGKKPPVWLLQAAIGITGILVLGRSFFISKIKISPQKLGGYNLKNAFFTSIRNAPLVGFAVYVAFMSLAFAAVLPLTLIYLKNGLHYGDNIVQILSSIGMGGSICGFFCYGKLIRLTGIRNLQVGIHAAYILIPVGLFFCGENISSPVYPIAGLLFAGNFVFACFGCSVSQEILALARPGNITMANAFTQTYQMIGTACGRTVASLLLGNGILCAAWKIWDISVTRFQTIFLLSAGVALFCVILFFSLPSVVPQHEDYYNP